MLIQPRQGSPVLADTTSLCSGDLDAAKVLIADTDNLTMPRYPRLAHRKVSQAMNAYRRLHGGARLKTSFC